jgi:hypothetical protein
MREPIRKLDQVGAAHISRVCAAITLCFDVFNRSHDTEPRNMELWPEWEVGKIEGLPNTEARAEAVARVDSMFLEGMRQINIGPSLIYLAIGAVPHITIDYTATSDSYSTFVTAHFPPQ